jgi:Mrp family chromosome partitioning ATPase
MPNSSDKKTISIHQASKGLSNLLRIFPKKYPASRSYRYLARQIEQDFNQDKKGCTVMFTSPNSNDLTSEALMMFAYFLQDELGYKVLLIDATFREEGVSSRTSHIDHPGLADLLCSGQKEFNQAIFSTNFKNISILPAGKQQNNSAITLKLDTLVSILKMTREKFGYVLIQTGSIIDDSRYLLFPELVDLVVLLVENGKTQLYDIETCQKILKDHRASDVRLVLSMT